MAAIAPIRLGDSRSPAAITRSPAAMSAPRRPMCWPTAAVAKISISFPSALRAVSSTMTTASAPAGSGAPVAISAHVPGAIVTADIRPV